MTRCTVATTPRISMFRLTRPEKKSFFDKFPKFVSKILIQEKKQTIFTIQKVPDGNLSLEYEQNWMKRR